jgi:hypothetical protein
MTKKFNYRSIIALTLICLNILTLQAQSTTFIEKVQNYQDSVKITRDRIHDIDIIDSATFNLNHYMQMFSKLKLYPKLEYAFEYFDNFLDGEPYIYVKQDTFNLDNFLEQAAYKELKNSKRTKIFKDKRAQIIHPKPFQFLNDSANKLPEKEIIELDQEEYSRFIHKRLYEFLNDSINRVYNNVIPEDSEDGYLQYLLLRKKGELFALKWHAYYKEKSIICNSNKIKQIVKDHKHNKNFACDKKELKNLLKVDPTPIIKLDSENCFITWLENETHNGIYKRTYKISRSAPYRIKLVDEKLLVNISIDFVY